MNSRRKIPVIAGPTAVGKTEYAIRIARALGGEIVSADSMQIYRYMDIGSAKPDAREQAAARHHLVDAVDPRTPCSAAEYRDIAKKCIREIFERNRLPVLCGGTGLYISALIYDMDFSNSPRDDGLRQHYQRIAEEQGRKYLHSLLEKIDPDAAARIHPNNVKKVIRAIEAAKHGEKIPAFENSFRPAADYEYILIGLRRPREELYDRINRRVDVMMDSGLEDEVRRLVGMGLTAEDNAMKGIGYKEMIGFLNGEYDRETAKELIRRNSRRYAKRQMTWFRRYPDMRWFDITRDTEPSELLAEILRFLKERGIPEETGKQL